MGVLDLKTSFFFKYLLLRYKTPPKKKKGQKFPRQSKMLLFRKTQLLNHKPKLYEKTVHNFLIWYLLYLVDLCINWSRIKWIFHDLAKKNVFIPLLSRQRTTILQHLKFAAWVYDGCIIKLNFFYGCFPRFDNFHPFFTLKWLKSSKR